MAFNERPLRKEGHTLFTLKLSTDKSAALLEGEIVRVLEAMTILGFDDEAYPVLTEHLDHLYKLKEIDSKKKLSVDAMLAALTSILGILIVVGYEHAHVIVSQKAFSMVGKNLK